jgi:hypothetical protein
VKGWDISNSEIRHSLFRNPRTGFNYASDLSNSVWGYYADGFFDRRPITDNIAVASGTRDVAYVGRLFYNTTTCPDHYGASLFVPNGGNRNKDSGDLSDNSGTFDSYYWTSSIYDITGGIILRLLSTNTGPWIGEKTSGAMVRCVRE